MKRLLAILAAVGLTATTTGSVVACGTKAADAIVNTAMGRQPITKTIESGEQKTIGETITFNAKDATNLGLTEKIKDGQYILGSAYPKSYLQTTSNGTIFYGWFSNFNSATGQVNFNLRANRSLYSGTQFNLKFKLPKNGKTFMLQNVENFNAFDQTNLSDEVAQRGDILMYLPNDTNKEVKFDLKNYLYLSPVFKDLEFKLDSNQTSPNQEVKLDGSTLTLKGISPNDSVKVLVSGTDTSHIISKWNPETKQVDSNPVKIVDKAWTLKFTNESTSFEFNESSLTYDLKNITEQTIDLMSNIKNPLGYKTLNFSIDPSASVKGVKLNGNGLFIPNIKDEDGELVTGTIKINVEGTSIFGNLIPTNSFTVNIELPEQK